MDAERYLSRIGLEPTDVRDTDLTAVERLQQAHLTTVPFETMSVAGYPSRNVQPEGVSLNLSDMYEKIVENRRGGICYELNGLFGWLLGECGFDVDRLAARVISPEDGAFGPPGGHQPLLVSLDGPYIVDVGFGGEVIRQPLPLDGTAREGPEGAWRVVESERSDADYVAQSKGFGGDEWTDWFIFRTEPRDMEYFEPACEYHTLAPDATFTDWVLVTMVTESGHKTLTPESFAEIDGNQSSERSISEQEWVTLLDQEFGIQYRAD
jgi:N-hydroxyarylamine O-acetyltransferase